MPRKLGKRTLTELTRKLNRAERQLRLIEKAREDHRGHKNGLTNKRKAVLDDLAELAFAVDVLRQAYASSSTAIE